MASILWISRLSSAATDTGPFVSSFKPVGAYVPCAQSLAWCFRYTPPPPDAHFFFEEPHCTNGLGSFGEFENGKDIVLSHVVQLDLRQRPASIVCSREGSFPTCTFVYLFYSEKLHVHVSSHTLWGCFLESTDDNIS